MSRYQKGKTHQESKTNLDLMEQEIVSGSSICSAKGKSAPRTRQQHQNSTTQLLQVGCPSCHPTNSVKAGVVELVLLDSYHFSSLNISQFFLETHTHNRFTALLEYVRDHPGEQVPER